VSFAPEATLHTWNVVEFVQDSTASSGSIRRASSAASTLPPSSPASSDPQHSSPIRTDDDDDDAAAPSATSPERAGGSKGRARAARDSIDGRRRKRRRRSSDGGGSQGDDDISERSPVSSPWSGASGAGSDDLYSDGVSVDDANTVDTADESTEGDSTGMSLDSVDMTTSGSGVSTPLLVDETVSTSSSLNEQLHRASEQAGTLGIDYDEHGDLPMELVGGDQTTAAFQPRANRRADIGGGSKGRRLRSFQDLENRLQRAPSAANTRNESVAFISKELDNENDATMATAAMEMTRPLGRIIQAQGPPKNLLDTRNGLTAASAAATDAPLPDDHDEGEATMAAAMEMTCALGQIIQHQKPFESHTSARSTVVSAPPQDSDDDMNEDDVTMTAPMEMTRAVGGIIQAQRARIDRANAMNGRINVRSPEPDVDGEATMPMEMTRAIGGILTRQRQLEELGHARSAAPPSPRAEPEDDSEFSMTVPMEMTRAVGGIVQSQRLSEDRLDKLRAQQIVPSAQQQDPARRQSAGESSSLEDASMELTVVVGGIQSEETTEHAPGGGPNIVEPMEGPVKEYAKEENVQLVADAQLKAPASPDAAGAMAEESMDLSAESISAERITLQEFLDMTGIQFMDLTTIKRRPTPRAPMSGAKTADQDDTGETSITLVDRVRAATCTLPMLELYQHVRTCPIILD
jgi:kinetochore protein Spc7/SPC105